MKVTILKGMLAWDESSLTLTTESVQETLRSIGVAIVVDEEIVHREASGPHNAIIDEIEFDMRAELPTRDDLPVAPVAKETKKEE